MPRFNERGEIVRGPRNPSLGSTPGPTTPGSQGPRSASNWTWLLVIIVGFALIVICGLPVLGAIAASFSSNQSSPLTEHQLNEETNGEDSSPSAERFARITFDVEEVNLRKTPGYLYKDQGDIITTISAGELVQVVSGPKSADGLSWWLVTWQGSTGWMADHTGSGRTILDFTP
jgi:hypothetical protein